LEAASKNSQSLVNDEERKCCRYSFLIKDTAIFGLMTIIPIITTRIIVLTQNQSPRNQNQKRRLRELRADFYTCHCWPCNNMFLNMISLCCYTSSCSDTLSDMCNSSVPTGYLGLALLSCKPASVRSLPSPIHYFRATGDVGSQSEPFSKQTSDS